MVDETGDYRTVSLKDFTCTFEETLCASQTTQKLRRLRAKAHILGRLVRASTPQSRIVPLEARSNQNPSFVTDAPQDRRYTSAGLRFWKPAAGAGLWINLI